MKTIFAFVFTFLFCGVLAAQQKFGEQPNYDIQPRLEANFTMGFPTGEFADFVGRIGVGAGGAFTFPISRQAPGQRLGVAFDWLGFGSNRVEETLEFELEINSQVIDVIRVPLAVETQNSNLGAQFFYRSEFPLDFVVPYLQALVGFRYLGTTTRVEDNSNDCFFCDGDNRTIVSENQVSDWTFSYGFGGGLGIKLGQQGMRLNLMVNYLINGEASYFTEEDIENIEVDFTPDGSNPTDIDGDDFDFSVIETTSDINHIMVAIGLSFPLGGN